MCIGTQCPILKKSYCTKNAFSNTAEYQKSLNLKAFAEMQQLEIVI